MIDRDVLDLAVQAGLVYQDSSGEYPSAWREDTDLSEFVLEFARLLTERKDALVPPMTREMAATIRDAECFRTIRKLMGYVENGSETTLRLYQDDATRDFFVQVGKESGNSEYGMSLQQAVEKAGARWPEEF